MSKKYLLTVLCFLTITSIFSQAEEKNPPNYKAIKKEVSDKNSAFYYPKLFDKFLKSDTTMTLREKRLLYYGFQYQSKYSPYGGHSSYNDSLKTVFQKQNFTKEDFKKVITFSDSILSSNPFDLRSLNYQTYALQELGNKQDYLKKLNQMRTIIQAIFSSGNGLKKETAFYVIYVSHEYVLLDILGYKFGGQQQLIDHYDYLRLAENPENIKGMYFDVSASLNAMKNLLD